MDRVSDALYWDEMLRLTRKTCEELLTQSDGRDPVEGSMELEHWQIARQRRGARRRVKLVELCDVTRDVRGQRGTQVASGGGER